MAERRDAPYVWVTWLTKLLSGESDCTWAAWHKAGFKYAKRPSDFDFAKWNQDHAALLRSRADTLRKQGYTVKVEGQNAFKLLGKNGVTLAGKPDILAVKGNSFLVDDAKTGQTRDSDCVQVQIYLVVAPLIWPQLADLAMTGNVVYRDKAIPVPLPDATFRSRLRALMDEMAVPLMPERVPSSSECKFCDVDLCPDRITESEAMVRTELF